MMMSIMDGDSVYFGTHTPASERKQVAALCWRKRKGKREVLLITSRETRRWVIPKGWPMESLKDFNAAKTEAFEEAGVTGRISRQPLGRFRYNKIKGDVATPVSVTVYGLEVAVLHSNWPERRERKRDWFAPADAAERVVEVGLKSIILQVL
jgi:8-oxo-dGTP pyrophosphatase MutT (NUDIX family)